MRYRGANLRQAARRRWEPHSPRAMSQPLEGRGRGKVHPVLSQEEVTALLQGLRQVEWPLSAQGGHGAPSAPPVDARIFSPRRPFSQFRKLSEWFAAVTKLQLPLL